MSPGENLEQELCLIFFFIFVLLGRGRRGQRKNEGDHLVVVALIPAGAEECRICRTFACWCLLLLVAPAACCCCMLLLRHAVAAADVVASVHFPNKNPIFSLFLFPIMRIAEGLQL